MKTKESQMRFRSRAKEGGQALVLVAMLMVILLGMLGLAIDGGGMFLLWRDAQNAVDAAALQAAFAYCTNGEDLISAQEAGYTATEMNGFDNNTTDNWVTVDRAVNVVAASELPSNADVKNDIILVQIIAEKPSYFIQLLYPGPLRIEVTALGVCNAGGESFFEGYGVYAMGNCPGSYSEADFTGANAHFFANIGSNGDLRVNGSQAGIIFHETDGTVAGVDWVDSVDDLSKFNTDPAGEDIPGTDEAQVEKAYEEFPVLYRWEQFVPGGEIYNAVEDAGEEVHYINGDYQFDFEAEGLWVVNGDVDYTKDFEVGPMGVTIVAKGQIQSQGNINNKNSPTLWKPFSSTTGLTNLLLFFSAYAPNGNPPTDCTKGMGNAAVKLGGSGIIGLGMVYAPYAHVDWSGSEAYWCGSIITLAFDSSGSDKWIFTADMPSDAALETAGAGDWFIDTDFIPEGTSCDYVPESDSEVFLGDL